MQIAGGAACLLCLVPGLPKLPFLLVGGGLLIIWPGSRPATTSPPPRPITTEAAAAEQPAEENLLGEMIVDPLELTLSPDLVPLVDGAGRGSARPGKGAATHPGHRARRGHAAGAYRDSVLLPQSTYAININGVEVSRGQAPPGMVLAIGDGLDGLPGKEGREPVFGLTGKWLPAELRAQAELLGATVVDRSSLIITHMSESVRQHASRLLGREEVAAATKALKRSHPTVVEDLTPALLNLGEIQRVLHTLLDEGVSIRDLVRIYESLSVAAKGGTDPDRLVEAARASLAPAIVAAHTTEGRIDVLTIEPRLQQTLLESVRPGDGGRPAGDRSGPGRAVDHRDRRPLRRRVSPGGKPVLVCVAPIRTPLRRLLRLAVPALPILSYPELSVGSATVNALGMIEDVRDAVGS